MNFRMVWMGPDDPDPSIETRSRRSELRNKAVRYERHGAQTVRIETRENGTTRCTPIANFSARVVSDITTDDGLDEKRQVEVEAEVAGKSIRVLLGAAEFSRMNWILRELGPKAIIYPGQQQHARAAIQSLSGEIRQERIFAHLGWRKHGEQWLYLQPGEVIGAHGPDLRVKVADALKHYQMHRPADAESLKLAVRSSLDLISLAPDRVMIPLLASVYRAPLGSADFSLFLVGRTGTFKTALAALCQQHFGPEMNASRLPANFASTPSALEEIAFQAKDALVVIDDFVPTGRSTDTALQGLAERIFRAAGNRQGHSRMSGLSLRAPRPPRAFLMATGEQLPQGHSIRARLLIIDVRPGDVDRKALTRAQIAAEQGKFAAAVAGYLAWIAPRYEEIQSRLTARSRAFRDQAGPSAVHARLPAMIAELRSGWESFLEFANDTGAISTGTRTDLAERAQRAFEQVAALQACHDQASDLALRFLALLRSALSDGKAHVADRSGCVPENPEHWGWCREGRRYFPCGDRIGWLAGDDLFLDPTATHQVAQHIASDPLPLSAQAVRHRLHQRGLLRSIDKGRQMLLVRRVLGGSLRQVLHLNARDFVVPEPHLPFLFR